MSSTPSTSALSSAGPAGLPIELWVRIGDFCNERSRAALKSTCKELNEVEIRKMVHGSNLTYDEAIKKIGLLQESERVQQLKIRLRFNNRGWLDREKLMGISEKVNDVMSLFIKDNNEIKNQDVEDFCKAHPEMECLYLEGRTLLTEDIGQVTKHLIGLRKLCLSGPQLHFNGTHLAQITGPCLKRIELGDGGNGQLGDQDIVNFLQQHSTVRTVRLFNFQSIVGGSWNSINLKSVKLTKCQVSDQGAKEILESCPNLVKFRVELDQTITSFPKLSKGAGTKLEIVSFRSCHHFDRFLCGKMPSLKDMNVSITRCSPRSLKLQLGNFPSLETLNFKGWPSKSKKDRDAMAEIKKKVANVIEK